jgi:hypothetical protein
MANPMSVAPNTSAQQASESRRGGPNLIMVRFAPRCKEAVNNGSTGSFSGAVA